MDRDPIRTATRKIRRDKRLENKDQVCLLCGYSGPTGLIRLSRRFLENHHVVGWQRDDDLVALLCRNCHAEASEGLLQEGISMKPEENPSALVAAMLDALAVFLEALVAAVRSWAHILRQAMSAKEADK